MLSLIAVAALTSHSPPAVCCVNQCFARRRAEETSIEVVAHARPTRRQLSNGANWAAYSSASLVGAACTPSDSFTHLSFDRAAGEGGGEGGAEDPAALRRRTRALHLSFLRKTERTMCGAAARARALASGRRRG